MTSSAAISVVGPPGAPGFLGENRREQFKVADGNGIEDQRVVLFVVANAVQMPQRLERRTASRFSGAAAGSIASRSVLAEIVDDRAGGSQRLRVIVESEACQLRNAELFAQECARHSLAEKPNLRAEIPRHQRLREATSLRFQKAVAGGEAVFLVGEELQFVAEVFIRTGTSKFRGLKFPGRKIDVSQADGRARRMSEQTDARKLFSLRIEERAIRGSPRRDDTDNFAAHQFLARTGLLHLIADGDFEPGTNQSGDVAFGSVVGNAAHGNGLTLFTIARSKSDLQFVAPQ